jgi:hypothetical protein
MDKETLLPTAPEPGPVTVIFLPIALYESDGTIFELYQGGQPARDGKIHWKRLKAVTVTRNNRDFVVEIYQRVHHAPPKR